MLDGIKSASETQTKIAKSHARENLKNKSLRGKSAEAPVAKSKSTIGLSSAGLFKTFRYQKIDKEMITRPQVARANFRDCFSIADENID